MKEKDVDFYSPCGKWCIYYRIFKFFPNGVMFAYLCSVSNPPEVRKAAAGVSPAVPGSLNQRLRGACWGTYQLNEQVRSGEVRTTINVVVPLRHEDYPRMKPATIGYVIELSNARAAASNCDFKILEHRCVYDVRTGDIKQMEVPRPVCGFMPFYVNAAKAKEIWLVITPLVEELLSLARSTKKAMLECRDGLETDLRRGI
eukprot:CAMPEP_0183339320 /NCGR_PEP_ID=MMETSP0164_2-20130417/6283_1 /TAXON_ID=221442 /ORGANISM="Coccolithus pelagicus ssp braarudi, Strain PLY182g" /LENGTH=200 /DNA_ID=CAMNT_0025509291 /DNA_START=702 /DNA_END=1304 /DNA_ORIENTATION=+